MHQNLISSFWIVGNFHSTSKVKVKRTSPKSNHCLVSITHNYSYEVTSICLQKFFQLLCGDPDTHTGEQNQNNILIRCFSGAQDNFHIISFRLYLLA